MTVFEDVMNDVDDASLNNEVESLTSLDGVEFKPDDKEHIQKKWDMLANKKTESTYTTHQYDDTLTVIINHASAGRVVNMAQHFASSMQKINVTDGADFFQAQHKLQLALQVAKIDYNDSEWYQPTKCEPERYRLRIQVKHERGI